MKIGLIFPHHLFEKIPFSEDVDVYYVLEEHLFFNYFKFHKQKIAFHRATLQSFSHQLSKKGKITHYIDAQSALSKIGNLIRDLNRNGATEIFHFELSDNWLQKHFAQAISQTSIKVHELPSPLFINNQNDLKHFFKADKKSFFQTTFYKQSRKKLNILLDQDQKPEGGQWTFDADNRKKYPKSKTPPPTIFPNNNDFWKEAIEYVEKHYPNNPGELPTDPIFPINFAQSKDWLNQFFYQKFYAFGDYEDAIVKEESFLHHSLLSPLINCGLLLPNEVIHQALKYANENEIPINSLEGFVRQIIGWREFIRGMYQLKGSEMRTTNYWNFKRKIPASFYTGDTGIEPLDDSIKKTLEYGYCHHIERLMVIGNFMLLCEFDPDEVYNWFMELFVDAYDWVMVPNVYGMSQFADGGLFATKPYISSSNYILKMSNYKKGNWQKVWDGLFWRFMYNHRSFFESNPRLGMLTRNLDRMSVDKLENHLSVAEEFLSSIDESSST
jgi:deoxyribodipyrimidine photolyase-related protein